MILLIRGLNYLDFPAKDIETISSIFTTWGHKLNAIITSIATGVAISLVPNLAKSNANKDFNEINTIFNKTLQIFIYIALPLALFMSIFAREIWTIFYGPDYYGQLIFKLLVITAAFDSLYIMVCNGLQGLNKTKLIYIAVISGLLTNLCLDLPLILLFNKIGIAPYYGAIAATIIGYTISLTIPLLTLKKKYNLNYSDTIKKIPRLLSSYFILILLCFGFRGIINIINNRLLLIILLSLIGIVLLAIYYLINKNEIDEIIGKKIKSKILRKKREK